MDAIHRPTDVRKIVILAFAELGVDTEVLRGLSETLLIREGHYYGRSYRAGDLMAMWMMPGKLVQFYAADGTMLRTVSLGHEAAAAQQRQAA